MLNKRLILSTYLCVIIILLALIFSKKYWLRVGSLVDDKTKERIIDSVLKVNLKKEYLTKNSSIFIFDVNCDFCAKILSHNSSILSHNAKYSTVFISSNDSLGSCKELKDYLSDSSFIYVFDGTKQIAKQLDVFSYPLLFEFQLNKKQYLTYEGADKINIFFNSIKE